MQGRTLMLIGVGVLIGMFVVPIVLNAVSGKS